MSSLVINDPRNGELIEYKSGNITKKKKKKRGKEQLIQPTDLKPWLHVMPLMEKNGSV